MYLLDTNVVSATDPKRRERYPEFVSWVAAASDSLYMSAITASEIHSGLAKLIRVGATRQSELLATWWQYIETLYDRRILDFDLKCVKEAGRLLDASRAHDPGYEDIAIAATAKVHGLTVLTANVRHFEPLCVPVINPFVALPEIPPRV